MIRNIARTLALLLAITAPSVALGGSAHADRAVLPDNTGDVWLQDWEGDGYSAEGSVVNTDLEHTSVRHQKRHAVVKARFVNLKKKVSEQIEFRTILRTDGPRLFGVFVHVDTWDGYTSFELVNFRRRRSIECDGLTGRVRFDTDTLRVSVPRTCLRKPRWIRFQGEANSYVEDEGLYVDNANGPGPQPKTWTRRLRRG